MKITLIILVFFTVTSVTNEHSLLVETTNTKIIVKSKNNDQSLLFRPQKIKEVLPKVFSF